MWNRNEFQMLDSMYMYILDKVLARSWASTFGTELSASGVVITKVELVNESFKDAKLADRDDRAITSEITKSIKNMMDEKISAVRRIMDAAENTAISSQDEVSDSFEYYNAKCLVMDDDPCTNQSLKADLAPNSHFWNLEVNTSFSAVHVPTNVYDRANQVLKAIKWSENLNDIFKNNYQIDPSLSWQYFGSSTGFMRQFPAIQWKQEPVDLYDCRTRSWFIEAATSPKDLVILVDGSGSMTGIRKEIARHVVSNILDTLGNNDFVNILSFNETTSEIEPCFKDILVQANLANIRNFKQKMEAISTSNIANFSHALSKAFHLLQRYRENGSDDYGGAHCNQAIMLITDGVPYNFKEIFEEFNWPNLPVRVFTYLVGREVADVREIKWMACANRGYYVHLSTLAEVREQVLHYIPVMARPLVLNRTNHPIVWTPVYADVTDPKMTDWLWQEREFAEQKRIFLEYRKHKKKRREEQDKKFITRFRKGNVEKEGMHPYKLMTSVSMPVFDRRENATRVANLLGVAGTDVPISEMQKLMNPFRLGVNGYAFIVTNNGYILYHPDFRPVGILKPNYNSIDMAEIELVSDGSGPREFSKELLDLRLAVISQKENGSAYLTVKYHYDDMRRVGQLRRKYYYSPIENSPFTVVVAVPADYGNNRVDGEVELHRAHQGGEAILDLFHGKNWRIHPDWSYCKYCNDTYLQFDTPEEELFHFLNRSIHPGWKWKVKPKLSLDGHFLNSSSQKPEKLDKDSYYCDRDLLQSVVYDAKVTKVFTDELTKETKSHTKEEEFKKKFGITVVFLATRSGLTRWKDFEVSDKKDHLSFGDIYNKAIDEIWYKRAVEQYYINNLSFVYSVPFDVGFSNDTLVTASRAVFIQNKAPAAVVGYQFKHSAMSTLFFNTVSSCPYADCTVSCASDDLDCFVLDNNGYVVVSENSQHTGRFFGEIHGTIMNMLVDENIYRRITVYDYQAVCFPDLNSDSSGNTLMAPLELSMWFLKWALGAFMWMLTELGIIYADYVTSYSYVPEEREMQQCRRDMYNSSMDDFMDSRHDRMVEIEYMIRKTRPESCDQQIHLYMLPQPNNNNNYSRGTNGVQRPFVVQPIPNTNLILVIVNSLCLLNDVTYSNAPEEIQYTLIGQDADINVSVNCHKILSNNLPRKRPKDCISKHEKEGQIELCGLGTRLSQNLHLIAITTFALRAIL
ncbi:hypothetical protein RUM43_003966 [Polyplax serrata]|uniref:VWFA domain-containing protein n=1 Tax=Polyplax serrata TaxID=468196 RepID=A0AAN8SAE0_POLSC